jgi:hypothetical protein
VLNPTTCHQGIGIDHANDYFFNASGNQGIATGWGAAKMIAGFQADVNGGTLGLVTSSLQGKDFGMGLTCAGMKAFTDDFTILYNHGSDQRIGGSFTLGLLG